MTFLRNTDRRWAASIIAVAGFLAGCGGSGGESDTPVSNSAGTTGGDFHSLVADPSSPGRLYVGGHTAVARSDDAGKTWTMVEALANADAMGWALEPDVLWVSGHPGLTRSEDGGATFSRRNDGLPDTDVHSMGGSGPLLYAAGPGIGVAVSSDAAATWTPLTTDAGQAFFGRIWIDPNDPDHLIAADVQRGAVSSPDGGRTWVPLGSGPTSWISSLDGVVIYASGGSGAQRSLDAGTTWEPFTVPTGASLVEAGPSGVVYAGVHDGNAVTVWVSSDAGSTWTSP